MDNLSFTPPLPCLISLRHPLMRREKVQPCETYRGEHSHSQDHPRCFPSISHCGGATPPPRYPGYPRSEVPQCLPAPEGRNSLALWCDSQMLPLHLSRLRSQRPEEAFTVNLGQNALTSPEFPCPKLNSALSRRWLMSPAGFTLLQTSPHSIDVFLTTDVRVFFDDLQVHEKTDLTNCDPMHESHLQF